MNNSKLNNKRFKREKITLARMIRLFCVKKHGTNNDLCIDCSALLKYSEARLSKCPFGEDKPVCSKCTVHCYSNAMRDKVKEVMRFSGPRMIFTHPYLTLMHILDDKIYKPLLPRSKAG